MVLEARYKAEKIGYPVIGERAKESSDVIDYNIQEEITKDASSVVNANNDTTTGMATVIPGVNAPKLIAKTSIIGIDFNSGYKGGVQFRFYAASPTTVPAGEEVTVIIDRMTQERNERGPYDFKYVQGKGIVMPTQGTYELSCTYAWSGPSGLSATYDTMVGGKTVHSYTTTSSETTETFNIDAQKGQGVSFKVTYDNTDVNSKAVSYIFWVTITKL